MGARKWAPRLSNSQFLDLSSGSRARIEFATTTSRSLVKGPRTGRKPPAFERSSTQKRFPVWRQANVNNQSAFERWDTNRRVDPQTFDWEPLCLAFRALDPVLGWAPEN